MFAIYLTSYLGYRTTSAIILINLDSVYGQYDAVCSWTGPYKFDGGGMASYKTADFKCHINWLKNKTD